MLRRSVLTTKMTLTLERINEELKIVIFSTRRKNTPERVAFFVPRSIVLTCFKNSSLSTETTCFRNLKQLKLGIWVLTFWEKAAILVVVVETFVIRFQRGRVCSFSGGPLDRTRLGDETATPQVGSDNDSIVINASRQ